MAAIKLRKYQEKLINMARYEFGLGHKRVLIVAPCGAGKTILSAFMCGEHTAKGGKVLYMAHRAELLSQAKQTFERTGVSLDGVTIMSVQTAARRLHVLDKPTMIVVDECHHIASKTYQDVLSAFPNAFVVGLTATPIRLDGKGLGETFESLVSDVTAQWLIENQYLAPYRYFSVPGLDLKGLKKAHGEFTASSIEEVFQQNGMAKIMGDAIAHYKRLADGAQAICYCPTVNLSQEYAKRFCKAGISAAHMDGQTPKKQRDEIVERFRRGDIKILCNVDLLGEGFDVPDCAVTIMLRPTASLSLYIQQAMRCMRYREGKRAIIIDHVGNYGRHGAPDDDRQWTLEGAKKKAKISDVPQTVSCPKCYAVLPAGTKVCPECEYEFAQKPTDEEENENQEDLTVKLQEIKFRTEREKALKECTFSEALAQAHSLKDLEEIQRARGYKHGWAWHIAKARGYLGK